MKDVTSKSGETEKQPREYAPDGPVKLAPNAPDSRGRLNSDGSKSKIVAERPTYIDPPDLMSRVAALENEARAMRNEARNRYDLLAARITRLESAAIACEKERRPLVTRSEPGPIDLDLLARRVAALEAK